MADWKQWDHVEILNIFRKVPSIYSEYLIQLRIPDQQHPLGSCHSFNIIESDFKNQLQELYEGKRERCYFSFGNHDIDFYKNKEGKFTIRYSPYEGLNMVFVLLDGELEKLLEEIKRDKENQLVIQLQQAGIKAIERIERLRIYHNQEEDKVQILRILEEQGYAQVDTGMNEQGAFSEWERTVILLK